MRTLVVQSHSALAREGWMSACVETVRLWAAGRGFDYRWLGDEALDGVPRWYRQKIGDRLPIAADLARLQVIEGALDRGYERVCWLDADVLVLVPDRLDIDVATSCGFGHEYWVQSRGARLKCRANVHNAVCVFTRGCPVLPFLALATQRIIARVDPEHVAPQLVGPKLLTALHNIVGFDLLETVGAISPVVARDVLARGGPAWDLMLERTPVVPAAFNLCASTTAGRDMRGLVRALIDICPAL